MSFASAREKHVAASAPCLSHRVGRACLPACATPRSQRTRLRGRWDLAGQVVLDSAYRQYIPCAIFLLCGMLSCIWMFVWWLGTLCGHAGHVEACAVVKKSKSMTSRCTWQRGLGHTSSFLALLPPCLSKVHLFTTYGGTKKAMGAIKMWQIHFFLSCLCISPPAICC